MRPDISARFDLIMSALRAVEPDATFDANFKRRFDEVVAEGYVPTLLERAAGRLAGTADALKAALLPQAPVLVKAFAVFMIAASAGVYAYSSRPAVPVITSQSGMVTAEGPLKPGSVITAADGAQADIELSDKYTIRIKDKARLKVTRLTPRYGNGKAVFELVEGKALVDIGRAFRGSVFIMDTRAGPATALGTKFSVDASREKTKVSVLEGKVDVKGVVVKAGQKTEVDVGSAPLPPQRLVEKDWMELEEIYQIGVRPRIMLLLKNTPDRVRQLLRPCPIYISGETPKEIPPLLEAALSKIGEAIKEEDPAKHLDAIRMLERIVAQHPDRKYNAHLLMYIGAYYEYVSDHEAALKTFEKVIKEYPDSAFASLALAAIGVIYEEGLGDPERANNVYGLVLERYPDSLEAIWCRPKIRH